MIQSTLKTPVSPSRSGRVRRLLARQEELRNQLTSDPLLDLETVRTVLGVSYGTLNRLLATGRLKKFQIGRGERKVRQSALAAYLAQGDQRQAGESHV